MVRLILDETYKYLSTVDWMDPNTRLAAQDKVKAIIPYVAYPQELLGKSTLSRHVTSRNVIVVWLS
jgi:Predicted metalloendopeptidase